MSAGSLWRHLKIAGLVGIWGVSSLSIRPSLELATHPFTPITPFGVVWKQLCFLSGFGGQNAPQWPR